MRILFAIIVMALSLDRVPAWQVPGSIPRPSPHIRHTTCTASMRMGMEQQVAHKSEGLHSFLCDTLKSPSKDILTLDPLDAVVSFISKAQRIKGDVQELSMNLVAEQSLRRISSSAHGDAAPRIDVRQTPEFYGRWKLLYSTDAVLQAAIASVGVHQEVGRGGGGSVTLRSIFGDVENFIAVDAHTLSDSEVAQRGKWRGSDSKPCKPPKLNRLPFCLDNVSMSAFPWLSLGLSTRMASLVGKGDYCDVVFCDGSLRVDWARGGAINIYSSSSLSQAGESASAGGKLWEEMEDTEFFVGRRRVPGICLDRLFVPVVTAAATTLSNAAPASAQSIMLQATTEDAALVRALSPAPHLDNGLALALVFPLLAYKVAAVVEGNKLLPELDLVIFFSVCALLYKFVH